jgi:hypothetical protein
MLSLYIRYRDIEASTNISASQAARSNCKAPHALDLSTTTKNNSENKGSAAFKAMIIGAKSFLSMTPSVDAGAKVVTDG